MATWPRAPPACPRRGRAGGLRRPSPRGPWGGAPGGGAGGRECLRPVLPRPTPGDRGGLRLWWRRPPVSSGGAPPPPPGCLCFLFAAAGWSAKNGHLETLRWARENGCDWNAETCECAADQGHLGILQWLRAEGCPWDWSTCYQAVNEGRPPRSPCLKLASCASGAHWGGRGAWARIGTRGEFTAPGVPRETLGPPWDLVIYAPTSSPPLRVQSADERHRPVTGLHGRLRYGVSGRGGAVGGRRGRRGLVLVRPRAAVHGLPARRPAGRGPAGPGPPGRPRRVRPAPRGPGGLRRAGAGGRGRVRRGQHGVRGRAAAAGGAGGGPRGHLPQDDGGPHAAGERGPARGQRLG